MVGNGALEKLLPEGIEKCIRCLINCIEMNDNYVENLELPRLWSGYGNYSLSHLSFLCKFYLWLASIGFDPVRSSAVIPRIQQTQ